MRTLCLAALALSLLSPCAAQSRTRHRADQTSFGLGNDDPIVKHPVSLSAAEIAALSRDDLMRQELDQNPPILRVTGEGLEASVIHLHGSRERDLVVIGAGEPFIGANVGPFWIIRDLPTGPKVVFRAITLQLNILKTSSHGLRDVEAVAATAVTDTQTQFRFNGTQYVIRISRTRPIK